MGLWPILMWYKNEINSNQDIGIKYKLGLLCYSLARPDPEVLQVFSFSLLP